MIFRYASLYLHQFMEVFIGQNLLIGL